ncbi:putative translation factor (SUA5) [Synechococcus sp. PCC 7502]|uniref:L-threonylcarbamoyladenylate synthase n=1 Tax=Synechococcus sp. PCC 7502 TaxID=1173263 RepID=UPI00029FDFAB|nr:L-threonylcarbamoyladenylate synthase [Synechococcus sp. PCC 7502]AFY75379.1 putative translation factor (SUA5) [Synechococcus sp. PCC 7502]
MALVAIASVIAGARAGKVISFPTDTVPALAVVPDHAKSIFALKQRSPDKPLILMAATLEELWDYVDVSNPNFSIWQELAQSRLPGALTLVLPQNPDYPPLNVGFRSIGIRIPDHKIAIALLRQTTPLLTTSANLSNSPTLLTKEEIYLQFPQVLVLDTPNVITNSQPSTVLAWTDQGWIVKRQGAVKI